MPAVNAQQLLAALAQSGLVPDDVMQDLRQRTSKAPGRIDPRSITKWLVQKKAITVEQALEFLAGKIPGVAAPEAHPAKVLGEDLLLADDLQVVDDDLEVVDDDLQVVDDDLQVIDDDLEVVDDALEEIGGDDLSQDSPQPAAKRTGGAKPRGPQSGAASPARQQPPATSAASSAAPLDTLLSGGALGGPTAAMAAPGNPLLAGAGPGARLGKPKGRKQGGNVWDSPLLLFGGGSLLALVIVGGVLYWAIGRQTGDEALRLAEEDYAAGSYTQSVHKFDQYLKNFPTHKGAGTARVHRGLAYLRQVIDGTSDWTKSLGASKQVLSEIAKETEFPQARAELAALLPKVAEGLAAQASKKPDQKLVDATEEALELVDKYVSKSMRPGEQLQAVEQSLALTKIELARGESLDQALADIKAAVSAGQPAQAYVVRKELLRTYPDLERDRSLQDAVLAISQSEKSEVRMVAANQPALTTEPETPILSTTTLVARTPGQVADVAGKMVFALAEGAAYGLEAATGKVAWRRFVGFDTLFVPRAINRSGASEAILVDSVRKELVCVEAATGKLRWRQSLGESSDAQPLVLRDRLAAAATDGRLLMVDPATGDSTGYVKFPHKLTVPPAADARGQHYYQLAEHSNLYVLSAQDGQCKEVIYLGHEAGSIVAAPITVSRYLLVAENTGARDATLRVFLADENGTSVKLVQSHALEGHVQTPPQLTSSKTLLVITDRGAFYTFDIGDPEKKEPLTKVASRPASEGKPLMRFGLARGAEFWVADNQLTKYDIQAAQGRLSAKGIQNAGDVFLQPLEAAGDSLVHVRRRRGLPGVAVAAANFNDGKLLWETHLGAPLAGAPAVDPQGKTVSAVNLVGGLFHLATADLSTKAVDDIPEAREEPRGAVAPGASNVRLASGTIVISFGGADRLLVLNPAEAKPRLRSLPLISPLAAPPLALGNHLLVPTRSGQVLLLDPATGKNVAEPFQPRLESGSQIAWRAPGLAGSDEAVLADDRQRLFRLGVADQPRPHLAARKEQSLTEVITSPVVATESDVYAADAHGRLFSFSLADLTSGADWNLKAPVSFGPVAIGERVLVATADGQLHCFAGQERRWQAALAHGMLAGPPTVVDGTWMLASTRGVVWTLNPADGQELAHVDLGQPLASGALLLGDQVLVAGRDGVLLKIARP